MYTAAEEIIMPFSFIFSSLFNGSQCLKSICAPESRYFSLKTLLPFRRAGSFRGGNGKSKELLAFVDVVETSKMYMYQLTLF